MKERELEDNDLNEHDEELLEELLDNGELDIDLVNNLDNDELEEL